MENGKRLLSQIRKLFPSIVLSFIAYKASAQDNIKFFNSTSAVQFGYGLKTTFDISQLERISFRIALSGGIGAFVGKDWFYPAINTDVSLYRGGIGSNRPGRETGKWFDFETVISYSATIGLEKRLNKGHKYGPSHRSYPLYYFNTRNLPSLQNPYRWSF
jgi:hypothetical protein